MYYEKISLRFGNNNYKPSEFDEKVFSSIIKAIYETTPQKENKEEFIEKIEYMKNLTAIMSDYPNVMKVLKERQNQKDGGDIDF